ncbi:hypothetical protein [Cupriavidus plantarum]|uniref:HdeA/HdeB family protein n=1 Tax=Cupriavidus plantarum TaxID=942865 RepID=A0A316FLA6_9BURK|nr:hypothetical protein [Cupriavidus plantarum]PWK38440.1 hypothetical protein C7419_1012336 [Cupriavidus plantarum]
MKKLIAVGIAATTLLGATAAHASTTFGMPDCGQWLASHTPTRQAWLLGYLSGANSWNDMQIQLHSGGKDLGPDILGKVNSADQIYAWMENYCRASPMRDVTDGAFILFTELMFPNAKK